VPGNVGAQSGALARDRPLAQAVSTGRPATRFKIETLPSRYLRQSQFSTVADTWLPGSILEQCGPDEWHVCVEVRELAVLRDGRKAPRGTPSRNLYYPCCFRGSTEIRPRAAATPSAVENGASR
jgi:hypothetical protein